MLRFAAVAGSLAAVFAAAHAQRLQFDTSNAPFSAEALVRGTAATEAQCANIEAGGGLAVWAKVASGDAKCIRYWAAGMSADAKADQLLVYVPGDPMDSNLRWETQTTLVDQLTALGANVQLLQGQGQGTGTQRHGLGASAQLVGSLCLRGGSSVEIGQVAVKGGLKG